MKDKVVSLEEWRALYNEAIRFRSLAPWDWLDDTDLFGVQNPEDEEVAWCSIMGGLGQFYALGAYLGSEGLESFMKLAEGIGAQEGAMFHSKMLMASFEDRNAPDESDRAIIKQLGLKFRGRNAWVVFRRHDPGYFPWYLEPADVRFLTHVLQQAGEVAREAQDMPFYLAPEKEGHYLVRVPKRTDTGWTWSEEWRDPGASVKKSGRKGPFPPPFDELRAKRIKGSLEKKDFTLELALLPLPMPIREGTERPFFPLVFLGVDHETGLILENEMLPMPGYASGLADLVFSLLEKRQALPHKILLEDTELYDLMKPIAKALGITVKRERTLPGVAEVKSELLMHFSPFGPGPEE